MKKFFCIVLITAFALLTLTSCTAEPYKYDLGNYMTIPKDWKNVSASQDEIDFLARENIEKAIEENKAKTEVVDRPAAAGDMVKLSFKCYLASDYGKDDATPIEALSNDNCVLIIGNDKYPSELEWAIRGHYINDRITAVRVSLPQNFGLKEFASAPVVYDVVLESITALIKPAYDDLFVASVSTCETVAEYEKMMKDEARKQLLWKKILEITEISSYPEEELNSYERDYISYYTSEAVALNCTLELYVNRNFFMSLTEFHQKAAAYAKDMVKRDMLLYSFERTYNLSPSDSEYQTAAKAYAESYGFASISALEAKFGTEYIRKSVLFDKVLAHIDSMVLLNQAANPTS